MSKDYLKGFNNGYVMAEHVPELAQRLSAVDSSSPIMDGAECG